MIYTLQITCEPQKDEQACLHKPVCIETMTVSKEKIGGAELAAVAEFFKQQVPGLLAQMAGREE